MTAWLNYRQLYYFWVIAKAGSVTQAARRLRLSQPNLSEQLRELEAHLGQSLFERQARTMKLTESGQIALSYANTIFAAGEELVDVLRHRPAASKQKSLRVGAINSLSKNIQFEFLRSLVRRSDVRLTISEGSQSELLSRLAEHELDVVISSAPASAEDEGRVYNHLLSEVPVYLVGTPKYARIKKNFPESLAEVPLFVSTHHSRVRSQFDLFLEQAGVRARVRAEAEDMALLRIFALSGEGLSVVPEIVVRGELASKTLVLVKKLPGVTETFYAITPRRRFPNPLVETILRDYMKSS